ncbi:DoxX family protein [Catellatospora sichuanensis]|uniref:DoxX family protein n=1 Tax=Catellatospora sichuanensis TaxID=1969805 RepID=UPI0011824D98|nr:DoxX family protein [Catellatospora sichuanensis]
MTTYAAPAVRPRRAVHIATWTGQVLLGLFFITVGATKYLPAFEAPASFGEVGLGMWFIYFVGACELAGGIGLLIPRLSGVAAIGLVGLMTGATIMNLFVLPGAASNAIMSGALIVVFALIARVRGPYTQALVRSFRR